MSSQQPSLTPETIWAYGYQIVPPQTKDRLRTINSILDLEHSDAKRGARTWRARVVLEKQVTHILVVSDSADQDREINRQLEAELKQMNVGFSITAPMAVTNDVTPRPAAEVPTQSSTKVKEKTR